MTDLYTSLVLSPYFATIAFVLFRLLLGVPQSLRRGGVYRRFEVAFEPSVEARVILALKRRAIIRKTVSHSLVVIVRLL